MLNNKISYFLSDNLLNKLNNLLNNDSLNVWIKEKEEKESNLIIIDSSFSDQKKLHKILKNFREKVILLSHEKDEANFLNYISKYNILHLVGDNSNRLDHEIKLNIDLMLKKETCSIDKLVDKNGKSFKATINDSKKVQKILDDLMEPIEFIDFFNTPKDYLKVLGNELVLNAIYGAACNNQGTPLYNHFDRKERVVLDREIEVNVVIDENVLALSVKDFYGSLKREVLVNSLVRSFKEKTFADKKGGAGLGFYLVFNHANQFIVDLEIGKSTEIICIIDKNKRFKSYKNRITSFHFFER